MVETLDRIGNKIGAILPSKVGHVWGVQGRERVVIFRSTGPGVVKVFTTLTHARATARECGDDAVRIVVGIETEAGFVPQEKGVKMLRTAPANPDENARVEAFLGRLTDNIREAWARARDARLCRACGGAMRFRKGKFGDFLGCANYPTCKNTIQLDRS